MDPLEPNALASGAPTKGSLGGNNCKQRSARGGSFKSNKSPSASQALANVLGLNVRLHQEEASGPGELDDHTAGVVTTVTTVTTPDDGVCLNEGGCQHEWTLRLGGRWGVLEACCGKCGEVAVRRAA
jgi:hypothetical protein